MSRRKKKADKGNSALKVIAIIMFVLAVVVAAFVASIGGYVDRASFPKSPLKKFNDEVHKYSANLDLMVELQCPTIPVMLYVKGEEKNVVENGCIFLTDDDFYISIYEVSGAPIEILNSRYADDLVNNKYADCSYEADADTMDVGYYNGYPAEYQCGKVLWKPEKSLEPFIFYTTTIALNVGYDKKVMVCVSTQDKKRIYNAEVLTENIALTVMDTSYTTKSSDSTEDSEAVEVKEEAENNSEESSDVSVIEEEKRDEDFAININSDFKTGTGIVLKYSNFLEDLSEVYAMTPENEVVPIDTANGGNGVAFFSSLSTTNGTWHIFIPANVDLGDFSIETFDIEDMNSIYGLKTQE